MLMALLARINQGGLHNPAELAAELATSPDLVDQMLDDLARMGYLEAVSGACVPSACSSCAGSCSHSMGSGGRTWTLLAKGRRAVRTNR